MVKTGQSTSTTKCKDDRIVALKRQTLMVGLSLERQALLHGRIHEAIIDICSVIQSHPQ